MFDEAKPYSRHLGGSMMRPIRANVRESRMTLYSEIANFNTEAEYDGRATCSVSETLHVACSVIHVSVGRLAMP